MKKILKGIVTLFVAYYFLMMFVPHILGMLIH